MSSISAQGVVERASAELSKRINGLGLRSKHHHGGSGGSSSNSTSSSSSSSSSGKTSVMERVTNVLCGGSSNSNSNNSNNSNNSSTSNNSGNCNNSNNTNSNNLNSNNSNSNTPDKPLRGGSGSSSGTNSHSQSGNVSGGHLSSNQQQMTTPASPTLSQQHHTTTITANLQMMQQQQQQLQSQIAGATLINSNLIATPTGIPMGAPPTPTVTSIAKQMNITIPGSPQFSTMGMIAAQKSQSGTPIQMRKQLPNPHLHHPYGGSSVIAAAAVNTAGAGSPQLAAAVTQSALILHKHPPPITSIDALMLDDRFLNKFFLYFSSYERRALAQVCIKWRDFLYRSPRYWSGLLPTLQCRELRQLPGSDRVKLYSSLIRRGFHALALVGASDEDALDVVHSFPLASKHIHSLSLRCSSISDRGLEALLDHLQSLFELELAGCNEVTEAGLWACLTPRIVSLSLADCINIADEAVGAVAQLLPSLYEFSLQAYHVTDAALGYFSPKQSHSLSILRLQSCWELTNHGIVNIVRSWQLFIFLNGSPSIVTGISFIFMPESPKFELEMGDREKALSTFQEIFAMNTGQPKEEFPVKSFDGEGAKRHRSELDIVKLGIHSMRPFLSREYFWVAVNVMIVDFCTLMGQNTMRLWLPDLYSSMESFYQDNEGSHSLCEMVEAFGDDDDNVHSLPHLTVLSLSGCSKLTDDGVELIAENLQKLRALDLSWCPRITDASLEYIACDLNQLEELTLDRCVHITDIGVGYISTMLSLTALFLRWCSHVHDLGLQHLCSMRNLQVLSLAGCMLTSAGLSSLIQLRHLQELELTNCPGASHELFDYLKEHLPRCLIIE